MVDLGIITVKSSSCLRKIFFIVNTPNHPDSTATYSVYPDKAPSSNAIQQTKMFPGQEFLILTTHILL